MSASKNSAPENPVPELLLAPNLLSPHVMSVAQLASLIGTAQSPLIVDVRTNEDRAADQRMLPTTQFRDFSTIEVWGPEFTGRHVVVICQKGLKLSHGVAAWLRHLGARADVLDGGFLAWAAAGYDLIRCDRIPKSNATGRTVWVTRARPKIDRIACPWLIRRFVDRDAVFLFVAPTEVQAVADRFDATPFDIEGVFWSHRNDRCTFDTMLEEFGLRSEAMMRLATIVRAADTARLDLAPQAAGLLAASLGFSRMHATDLAQFEASLPLYDALYLWSRDAAGESHNWPAARGNQ